MRSDGQKAILFETRSALLHSIEKWRQLQAVYMPGALNPDTTDPDPSQRVKAESIKLWLPSQLDAEDRNVTCLGGVIESEKKLRFAQLEDSLNDLRRARRTRHGLITFHKVQLAGQGQKSQTKSQAAMQTVHDRIDRFVRRYRVARNALLCLDPHGDWAEIYLPLTADDNRGPMKELEEIPLSDGQYTPSWIWLSNTTTVSRDEVNEDMRVEWAQCVARADHWEEEAALLQEEMRRVVQFLEWRSSDWLAKADLRARAVTPVVLSGLAAYANKQTAVFHNLAVRFCQHWRSAFVSLSLPHNWATEFLKTHKEPLSNLDFKERKKADSSLVHPRTKSSTLVAAPAHIPTSQPNLETINHEAQVHDVDSDGTSEDDESGYESTSSLSE